MQGAPSQRTSPCTPHRLTAPSPARRTKGRSAYQKGRRVFGQLDVCVPHQPQAIVSCVIAQKALGRILYVEPLLSLLWHGGGGGQATEPSGLQDLWRVTGFVTTADVLVLFVAPP
jgi:hypothetical protein